MGQEVGSVTFSVSDFERFARCLRAETGDLLAQARSGAFADQRVRIGFELESWLVDHHALPHAVNDSFLRRLDDAQVVPELSRFNVELNAPPLDAGPGMLDALVDTLARIWHRCQRVAHAMDTTLASIGILPTLREADLCIANMSALNRYAALNRQVLRQRGGMPVHIDIAGEDRLILQRRDVMLEAATTSFQLHLQVPYPQVARHYDAAVVAAAPLLAAAGNSPLLFGRRLWQETRVPLFEQAIELGGYAGLADPGVRRVSLGQGYVGDDVMQLFEQNLHLFPVLLPVMPSGDASAFPHVRLHNGCIWRWVRPLIGFSDEGILHLRLEQRVLPAGPTLVDMVADAAFNFGLTRALAGLPVAPDQGLPFGAARENFYRAARDGLDARLRWLDGAEYPADELIRRRCLPMARDGLLALGLDEAEIERHLIIIALRVASGQTGAAWQLRAWRRHGGDARALMLDYLEKQRAGAPVHEWDV